MSSTITKSAAQEIRADSLYSSRELRRRFAIGDLAWRRMKAGGLKVYTLGKTRVIHGADLIAFLESQHVHGPQNVEAP